MEPHCRFREEHSASPTNSCPQGRGTTHHLDRRSSSIESLNAVGMHDFGWLKVHLFLEDRASFDPSEASPDVAWMDAARLEWPLKIRSWQPGDRFQPLGLTGSKKLQDYFTDSKIGKHRRGQIPLLCDSQKICWIMGHRLDERVRVTAETRQILIVEYHNHR